MTAAQRVVIAGAGFAGLYAAKALRHLDADVTIVDRNNYHLFQPLLYQVATGLLDPSQIAYPVRASLRRSRKVSVVMAEIESVDLEERLLHTTAGNIAYDILVVATGSTNNYFGIPEMAEAAPGLKTLPDALHLRALILAALERATRCSDDTERQRLLSFTIVGAGPTGVEMAGAVSELLTVVLGGDYRGLSRSEATVTLLETRDQVLATFAPRLGRRAVKTLRRKGVTVKLGRQVVRAEHGSLVLDDGSRVDAGTTVWTAGVQAVQPAGLESLPRTGQNRIAVSDSLSVAGHPEVFVAGDCAALMVRGAPLPMLAAVALQQGRHIATVLEARSRGLADPPFRYLDKGNMATIGRGAAVADIGPVHINGFIGWLMWLGLHLLYIAGFRSRAVVIISWAQNFFFFDRSVRLILDPAARAAAASTEDR
ncbi:MAG: NAD(P)/FAD-dependent oxidoreductase [Candidatus Dormibacteraeota bacterium]|nr:NAD(P)/FAD-dependent oxidoreductase [Candidatus Dormibacteraeota bacterium]